MKKIETFMIVLFFVIVLAIVLPLVFKDPFHAWYQDIQREARFHDTVERLQRQGEVKELQLIYNGTDKEQCFYDVDACIFDGMICTDFTVKEKEEETEIIAVVFFTDGTYVMFGYTESGRLCHKGMEISCQNLSEFIENNSLF